ncbi:MAG: TonB-dependent receptor [Bacteroidales bacterium]
MRKKLIIFSLFIVSSTVLFAEGNPSVVDSSKWEHDNSQYLKEVVVTATRQEAKMVEIPSSITYLSGKTLDRYINKNLNQVSLTVPGLYVPKFGTSVGSPVYLRGVGSRIGSPSVGLYVDGVSYFQKNAYNFQFLDVDNMEVLKGPQGSLYGRNSIGGVIVINSISPMKKQFTEIEGEAATHGRYSLKFSTYQKPSDKFAYSLSAYSGYFGGFFNNVTLDEKMDKEDWLSFRNKLVYKPSKKLVFENTLSLENRNEEGEAFAPYVDGKIQDIVYNQDAGYKRFYLTDGLKVKYILSDNTTLNSSTGFSYMKDNLKKDQDYTADSIFFMAMKLKANNLTEEISLNYASKRVDMVVGAYAWYSDEESSVGIDMYSRLVDYVKSYNTATYGGSMFGQTSVKDVAVEGLSFTLGMRYDYESIDRDYNYVLKGKTMVDTSFESMTFKEITGKFGVLYEFNNKSVYGTISNGFKSGGYNDSFERPEDMVFSPEKSINYEIGAKANLGDKVYADLSMFYIDWTDQQVYMPVPSGTGRMIKNAGESVSKGIEASLNFNNIHEFYGALSYGLTNLKFTNYVYSNNDYRDKYAPYVPKHAFSAMLGRKFMIDRGFINLVDASFIYNGQGSIYWTPANDIKQDYYGLIDMNVSIYLTCDARLSFWASNLLNEKYTSFLFESGPSKFAQPSAPQQFGMKLAYKF